MPFLREHFDSLPTALTAAEAHRNKTKVWAEKKKNIVIRGNEMVVSFFSFFLRAGSLHQLRRWRLPVRLSEHDKGRKPWDFLWYSDSSVICRVRAGGGLEGGWVGGGAGFKKTENKGATFFFFCTLTEHPVSPQHREPSPNRNLTSREEVWERPFNPPLPISSTYILWDLAAIQQERYVNSAWPGPPTTPHLASNPDPPNNVSLCRSVEKKRVWGRERARREGVKPAVWSTLPPPPSSSSFFPLLSFLPVPSIPAPLWRFRLCERTDRWPWLLILKPGPIVCPRFFPQLCIGGRNKSK